MGAEGGGIETHEVAQRLAQSITCTRREPSGFAGCLRVWRRNVSLPRLILRARWGKGCHK